MAITLTLEGLPENITARTTTYSRYKFAGRRPRPCTLMEVVINFVPGCLDVPCFRCTRFLSEDDYYNYYELYLTIFIRRIFFRRIHSQDCASQIAYDIVSRILQPVNRSYDSNYMTHRVHLQIQAQTQTQAYRVIEHGPQRRPCSIESVIEMIMTRARLKTLEGENAERDWKESGDDHDCTICLEKIESVWDSLQSPCAHVFHEKCVLRWFDDNHVCPICRFELPLED